MGNKRMGTDLDEDNQDFLKYTQKPTAAEVEEVVADLEAAQPSTSDILKEVR
jgi:hypothetical protein